jgi:hypothetical protein
VVRGRDYSGDVSYKYVPWGDALDFRIGQLKVERDILVGLANRAEAAGERTYANQLRQAVVGASKRREMLIGESRSRAGAPPFASRAPAA